MKDAFWMFAIILMIITLISSIGGGIRYRENFIEEVFDMNDSSVDPPTGYDYYPIHHPVKAVSEAPKEMSVAPKETVKKVSFEDKKIEEEAEIESKEEITAPVEKTPIKLNKPAAVPCNHKSTPEFVVPYGGAFFAPF